LKNSGNVSEMKRKVKEWEGRGFNVSGLKYKLKGMRVKDMKKLMNVWKRKGYK